MLCHALDKLWVGMAKCIDCYTGGEVEILATLSVPDVCAGTTFKYERRTSVDAEKDIM